MMTAEYLCFSLYERSGSRAFRSGREVLDYVCGMLECDWGSGLRESSG